MVSSIVLSDEEKRYHYDNFGTAEAPEIDLDDIINSGLLEMMSNLFKPKKGSRKRTRHPHMSGMPNFNKLFKGMDTMFSDLGGEDDDDDDFDIDINDLQCEADFEHLFGKGNSNMMNFMFKMNKPSKPKKKKADSDDEWEDEEEEWEDVDDK